MVKVRCITEGYLKATQKLYAYAGEKSGSIDTLLSQHSERILDIYAAAHKVSKLSQMIIQLIVLLEISNGAQPYKVSDTALKKAIKALQMTWSTMQPPAGQVMEEIASRMPLTDAEITMFRSEATDYIRSMIPKIKTGPAFYPLEAENFRNFRTNMGIMTEILELDLWEENPPINEQILNLILKQLKHDATKWLQENVDTISSDGVLDNILDEITKLSNVLNLVVTHCTPVNVISTFFAIFGVNYYQKISVFVDSKISMKSKELMLEMNRYQLRYYKFPENITNSSKVSLSLYTTLRKLYNILKCNLNERELFLVTLGGYQSWFQETLMYWLTTFKVECQNRLTKALEIDKDIVLVTSLLKFSNSSVDVLSCFSSITMEWREIDFADPDTAVMGVTKITDFICDCVKLYADKIHMTLKNNGYYDEQENHFDITDQLCITLNNIEHVTAYLKNLEHELDWEKVANAMSTAHESEEIRQQVLTTLHRLTRNCCSDINLKSRMLITEIVDRMKMDLNKKMEILNSNWKALSSSVDLKNYLQSNMDTLKRRLHQSVYPLFIEELWEMVITLLEEKVGTGKEAEYYQTLHKHVRNLRAFFLSHLDPHTDLQTEASKKLEEWLAVNSKATEELMLKYFAELNQNKRTPEIDYGHIAVKVAYLLETRGYVTIFVKVINGTDLPGLDSTGLSDPYVIVALQPRCLFKELKPKRTKTVPQNLNPVFNASFQFNNIPQECLTTPGATIHLLVYDQDKLLRDDFAGEATIALSSIPQLNDGSCTTFDKTPTTILALRRPQMTSRALQVLQYRIDRDNIAKDFVQERLRVIENQRPRTDRAIVQRPLTLIHALKTLF